MLEFYQTVVCALVALTLHGVSGNKKFHASLKTCCFRIFILARNSVTHIKVWIELVLENQTYFQILIAILDVNIINHFFILVGWYWYWLNADWASTFIISPFFLLFCVCASLWYKSWISNYMLYIFSPSWLLNLLILLKYISFWKILKCQQN